MHRLVASWFGSGLILERLRGSHLGSGTLGSVFAFPVALLIGAWWGWVAQVAAAIIVTIASLWSTQALFREEGDAGWICIDEAAGTFIALIGLTFWPGAVIAWVVFRAADIFKNFAPGVAAAERLPGGLGITADDVLAGLYGLVTAHLVTALL